MRLPSFVRGLSLLVAPPGDRPRHFAVILAAFLGLGLHVGVQAVLLADLTAALGLTPADLGLALSAQSAAGIVALLVGGRLGDRVGRRPLLVSAAAGVGPSSSSSPSSGRTRRSCSPSSPAGSA